MRDQTLDITKGIGILLVVVGHIYTYNQLIYLFHMPLFFVLSGAGLSYSRHPFSIRKKWQTLMIPYFLFSFLCFLYWFSIESRFRPENNYILFSGVLSTLDTDTQQFINIFLAENAFYAFPYNVVLWFLPCLFVAECIYNAINHCKSIYYIGIGGGIILYYCLIPLLPSLPWGIDIALLAIPFIAIGDKLYKPLNRLLRPRPQLVLLITTVTFALFVSLYCLLHPVTNMGKYIIPNVFVFYGMALIGCFIVLTSATLITHFSRYSKPLAYIGRNSLIIMCIHEPVKRIVLAFFSKLSYTDVSVFKQSLTWSIFIGIITVLICLPSIPLIHRYFPWLAGKKRISSEKITHLDT